MPKFCKFCSFLALVLAVSAASLAPAAAELFGCHDKPGKVLATYNGAPGSRSYTSGTTHEFAAQSRPRITIHPRTYPGANATRHCRSWLSKEYRLSGTVVTPQMRCWWE